MRLRVSKATAVRAWLGHLDHQLAACLASLASLAATRIGWSECEDLSDRLAALAPNFRAGSGPPRPWNDNAKDSPKPTP